MSLRDTLTAIRLYTRCVLTTGHIWQYVPLVFGHKLICARCHATSTVPKNKSTKEGELCRIHSESRSSKS